MRNPPRRTIQGLCPVALLLSWVAVTGLQGAPALRGDLGIHDPSTVVRCGDRYYLFGTGQGIASKSSADKVVWNPGPPVFSDPPAWTTAAVAGFDGTFWAPDAIFVNGRYCLYYSVSTWGSQVSAIGLATNPTLDPTDPAYQWTDQGPVIQSGNGSPYNTIDPSVFLDDDGKLWMAFGSYWNGIYLVELDPMTGRRISPGSPLHRLAYNGSIEASCLWRQGGYYYLFVNWGSCCAGLNSTYHIRVGRSTSITGPYLDRNGTDLRSPGGTLFLESSGKRAGPGHVAVFDDEGQPWFTYHYYDAGAYAPWYDGFGAAKFDLTPLLFSADGWPAFEQLWSADYEFDGAAEEAGGQYYGLLQGGARCETDTSRDGVLRLDGVDDYAMLPAGVAYARTFMAVVNWNGGDPWQRVFDFGIDTERYLFLTPSDNEGRVHFGITPNRSAGIQTIVRPGALPVNQWVQVAVTLDGTRGVLYLNGAAVATNTAMSFSPLDVRAQTNFLGRSFWTADPYFNGRISSFRVFGRALGPAEIAAPHPSIVKPRPEAAFPPGAEMQLEGSARDFLDLALPQSALAWRVEYVRNGVTNALLASAGLSRATFHIPEALTNAVLQVSLTATDSSGRRRKTVRDVRVSTAAAPEDWGAFYPFTSDARDASNRLDGALLSGASCVSDPERGRVLRLSGAGAYAALPAGASDFRTFSAWAKWNGGNRWQRVFDFGNNTESWFFLSPRNGNDRMEAMGTTARSVYLVGVEAPFMLPTNRWVHVAVVFDGKQAVLYLDGEAVAANNSVTLWPADVRGSRPWLGRSQYPADPYFNGYLDSVYLFSEALAAREVRSLYFGGPTPPSLQISRTGQGARLHWPAWATLWDLQSSGDLSSTWAPVPTQAVTDYDARTVQLPIVDGSRFFRLQRREN